MPIDLGTSHSLRPCPDAAEFSLYAFLLQMLFHITMDYFRDHLDIAAAKREHSDCVKDGEAHRFVFGAV
jgi:hypothetical protein